MNNSALVPKSWLSVFIDKKKRENIDVWVEHCERRFIWSTCGQNWPFQSDMTPECRYTSKSGNSFSFQMQLSALWYRSTVKKKKNPNVNNTSCIFYWCSLEWHQSLRHSSVSAWQNFWYSWPLLNSCSSQSTRLFLMYTLWPQSETWLLIIRFDLSAIKKYNFHVYSYIGLLFISIQ